ncbi:MAG: cell division protein FtsQ/DivIB [Gammaproteobacteria bacterium SHHR-1]|uniref:cell division protein FtsQ/DivIB n=1 Tax=Magnetovirga frankeli TaxID=947516 RepID=UPI001AF07FAD|nr:cell division protein FtsQ/DivIB [gamma proteobacterium SS-5]
MTEPSQPEAAAMGRDWQPWLRGLRVMVSLFLVLALLLGVRWLSDPSVSPLRLARIEGDLRHLKRADLEQAVAASIRAGFFTVDVQEVKRAAEALPWVERVSVRRVWPDTLHLWVQEQQPLARWGEHALVNPRGQVFRPEPASIPQRLPLLHGPEGSAAELIQRYRQAQALLEGQQMAVGQLHLSQRHSWRLQTDTGIEVHLGREGFGQRLGRWLQVYARLRDSRPQQMQRVDMRYHNGMAVVWVDPPAETRLESNRDAEVAKGRKERRIEKNSGAETVRASRSANPRLSLSMRVKRANFAYFAIFAS